MYIKKKIQGIVNPNIKMLSSFTHPQVVGPHSHPQYGKKTYCGSQWVPATVWLHLSKYLLVLCSSGERN